MNMLLLMLALSQAGAPDAKQVERAKTALMPFKKQLKETLMGAMKTSPMAAIDVCARQAPDMAKAASKDGVTVGRSAFKLRNEGNAPKPWLEAAMKELAAAKPGSDASKAVGLPDGRVGYAEAIWVQAPCLVCHGETIAKPVDDELRKRYPKDAARGFKEGDFRGVFWAEVDAPAKK
ncbi:MAG: DUF3365 domain-containing protein [Myxococcota bacterium]|jgi:hypothetical protein